MQPRQPLLQQLRRVAQLERRRRVPDIGGRQPQVHPAPLRPQPLGDRAQERRHLVMRLGLVPIDLRQREARLLRDRFGLLERHRSLRRPRLQRRYLNLEPALVLGLIGPDRRHGRAGVAGNHGALSLPLNRPDCLSLDTLPAVARRYRWPASPPALSPGAPRRPAPASRRPAPAPGATPASRTAPVLRRDSPSCSCGCVCSGTTAPCLSVISCTETRSP